MGITPGLGCKDRVFNCEPYTMNHCARYGGFVTEICSSFWRDSMYKSVIRLLILTVVAMLLTASAHAQENATITGTVLDPTGAVIPNVRITLTNPDTSQSRTTTTNDAGLYLFANVGIGHFNLGASATGFQRYLR